MAFDRTNPADLGALKTEVTTDPLGIGYNVNSTQSVLNGLNDGDQNPEVVPVGERLTVEKLFDAIAVAPSDLAVSGNFDGGEQFFIAQLLQRDLEVDIEKYRTAIQDALPQASNVRTTLLAQTRNASRAEVLFGTGTIITREDWFAARDYTGA